MADLYSFPKKQRQERLIQRLPCRKGLSEYHFTVRQSKAQHVDVLDAERVAGQTQRPERGQGHKRLEGADLIIGQIQIFHCREHGQGRNIRNEVIAQIQTCDRTAAIRENKGINIPNNACKP